MIICLPLTDDRRCPCYFFFLLSAEEFFLLPVVSTIPNVAILTILLNVLTSLRRSSHNPPLFPFVKTPIIVFILRLFSLSFARNVLLACFYLPFQTFYLTVVGGSVVNF